MSVTRDTSRYGQDVDTDSSQEVECWWRADCSAPWSTSCSQGNALYQKSGLSNSQIHKVLAFWFLTPDSGAEGLSICQMEPRSQPPSGHSTQLSSWAGSHTQPGYTDSVSPSPAQVSREPRTSSLEQRQGVTPQHRAPQASCPKGGMYLGSWHCHCC